MDQDSRNNRHLGPRVPRADSARLGQSIGGSHEYTSRSSVRTLSILLFQLFPSTRIQCLEVWVRYSDGETGISTRTTVVGLPMVSLSFEISSTRVPMHSDRFVARENSWQW